MGMDMMMDPKHQLLLAICEEYNKATPNISSISAWSLHMNQDVFHWALIKLDNEGLIHEYFNGFGNAMIKAGYIEGVLPTREGLEYAEKLMTGGETDGESPEGESD